MIGPCSKSCILPSTVLRERGIGSAISAALLCLIVTVFVSLNFESFVLTNGALWIAVIICRICLFSEEWKHVHTRYGSNYSLVVTNTFSLKTSTIYFCILSGFMFMILFSLYSDSGVPVIASDWKVHFVTTIVCAIIHCQFHTFESPLTDSIILEQMEGAHYGSSMAFSYYYGYLNLVLPNHGYKDSQSLKERIDDFIIDEGLDEESFPVKKFFILIPASAYIPGNLKELSEERMEEVKKKLKPVMISRAGNVARPYENTVYRIKTRKVSKFGGKHIYAVVQGASILLTMYTIFENAAARSKFSENQKSEYIFVFYKTLLNIVKNDARSRDMCHLIYYKDYNELGRPVNVADVVVEEIERLKFDQTQD